MICRDLGHLLGWLPTGGMSHGCVRLLKVRAERSQVGQRPASATSCTLASRFGATKYGCLPAIVPPLTAAVSAISAATGVVLFGSGFVEIQRPTVQVAAGTCPHRRARIRLGRWSSETRSRSSARLTGPGYRASSSSLHGARRRAHDEPLVGVVCLQLGVEADPDFRDGLRGSRGVFISF